MIRNLSKPQKKKSGGYTAALHTKSKATYIKSFLAFFIGLMVSAAALVVFTGCDREKPAILFSSTPFSKEFGYTPQNTFEKGEKIYYLLYNPKEFKTRLIKVQAFRKDADADEFWGYEYLYNKTVELQNKKLYTDYFIMNKTGYYIFQIFDFTNTLKPVIRGIVRVAD